VTSRRKVKANRANARASTGPRTAHGKTRSAQNARRHGLSISIAKDPRYSLEIDNLARQLTWPGASPQLIKAAKRLAEAQMDVERIRCARDDFIACSLKRKNTDEHAAALRKYVSLTIKFVAHLALTSPNQRVTPEVLEEALGPAPSLDLRVDSPQGLDGLQMLKVALSDYAKPLSALDRYERRVLSRRKFAIRAFDEASRNLKSHKGVR
jgi:hypothetical protein